MRLIAELLGLLMVALLVLGVAMLAGMVWMAGA